MDPNQKIDKAKFAGKGADLLHAASKLGKGKTHGKFLGKAETYLRKYQKSHSTNTTPHGDPGPANTGPLGYPPAGGPGGGPGPANAVPLGYPPPAGGPHNGVSPNAYPNTSAGPYPSPYPGGNGYAGGGNGSSGSGFGEYLKKASGFLKKH